MNRRLVLVLVAMGLAMVAGPALAADPPRSQDVGGDAVTDHGDPAGRQTEALEGHPEEGGLGLPDDHRLDVAGRHGDRLDDGATAGQELSALDG